MTRVRLNWVLMLGSFLIYLINRFFIKPLVSSPFIHGYLADLLAPVLLMSFAGLWAYPIEKLNDWIHKPATALGLIGFAALVWEVVAPAVLRNSTADPLDFIAYLAGGCAFLFVHRVRRMWH